MMTRMIRPCTLPTYWKEEEPIEACDIISFGFNWGSASILSFETVWKGQTSKNAYPELDLTELEDAKKWIDERYYSSDFESIDESDKEFLKLKYYRETTFLITEALNAPVQVTQAVLDAMEKVPEAQFWYVEGCVNVRLKWDDALKTFTVNGQTLSITDYIQADCPLALEVLLQFYTDGTPVKRKETE